MAEDTGEDIRDEDLAEAETLGDRGVITPGPVFDLPDFEGREVKAQLVRINGTSGRILAPIHIGDSGYAVIEWSCAAVNHSKTKEGLKRIPTVACDELWSLDSEAGRRLVAELRMAAIADGSLEGQLSIDDVDPGDEVLTDGNGVVLTVAESKALRR